jgi:hypothetical protein
MAGGVSIVLLLPSSPARQYLFAVRAILIGGSGRAAFFRLSRALRAAEMPITFIGLNVVNDPSSRA